MFFKIRLPLRIHTHCQVAQKSRHTDQNLSKSMAAQRTDRLQRIKHENTTRNIRKPGYVGNLYFCTFTQIYYGLISRSFEIPASAYCSPLYARLKDRIEHRNLIIKIEKLESKYRHID